MSDLDEVITSLRLKLAAAEEQKRRAAEVEAETKADPVKTLETIVNQTRHSIENFERRKLWHDRIHACQTVAYLEPILDMLKRIDERLNVLEAKALMSEPKRSPVRHNNDVNITL
jgi:hypothetical protein